MKDQIEREDAIEVVKRQRKISWKNWHETRPSAERIIEDLKELPSAQPDLSSYSDKLWRNAYERGRAEAMAELIRCKNCKWKQGAECVRFAEIRVFPDDFCSRAERRTDD